MLARIPVILVGIPVAYGLLVTAGDMIRVLFFTVICLIGQFELNQILNGSRKEDSLPNYCSFPIIEWLGSISIMAATYFHGINGLLMAFAFSVTIIMLSIVLRGLDGNGINRFTQSIFSLLYLPFFLGFFLLLAVAKGGITLFLVICAVWALDIGAYIFGISIKGPKLSPKISPNKTISGAIGGAVCCIALIMTAGYYKFIDVPQINLILLAVGIAIIGQVADLFESVLKRESGIKDSSRLLGAHGGILDRIDSVLFLGPLCYALLAM